MFQENDEAMIMWELHLSTFGTHNDNFYRLYTNTVWHIDKVYAACWKYVSYLAEFEN